MNLRRSAVTVLVVLVAIPLAAHAAAPRVAEGTVLVEGWSGDVLLCSDEADVAFAWGGVGPAVLSVDTDCGEVSSTWTCAEDPTHAGRVGCRAGDDGALLYDATNGRLWGWYAPPPAYNGGGSYGPSLVTFEGTLRSPL